MLRYKLNAAAAVALALVWLAVLMALADGTAGALATVSAVVGTF